MAKKELTRDDILKKEYSELVKINQRLKNISEGYYIGFDGTISMKSLVPFVEKIIHLNNPEKIKDFFGSMVFPNRFFEFSKSAKKTKLVINELNPDKIIFGQDDDELTLTINQIAGNSTEEETVLSEKLRPKMYKRFFELESDASYIQYDDKDTYSELTTEEVASLVSSNPIYLKYNDTTLTITKHLFLDLKKDDVILISRHCYKEIEDHKMRVFYMIKHITELYTDYTIFNTLQS